jgi:endonuclease/exonuclease/phosphatase family metal-dependent hydrolase
MGRPLFGLTRWVIVRNLRPVLLGGLLFGCAARLPRDFGDLPADRTVLAEDPDLAHLVIDGGPTTVEALIRKRNAGYATPPDPTPRLAALAAAYAPPEGGTSLSVLTYNVAFLDVRFLGTHVKSPHLEVRRDHLVATLFASHDVLLLQEVWSWESAVALGLAAEKAGYAWYAGEEVGHAEHGLFVAVRRSLLADGDAVTPGDCSETRYDAARPGEFWPGPNIRRGFLACTFGLRGTETVITVVDNHATSFPTYTRQRELQARQVGAFVAGRPPAEVVILGGDLNSGPYYPADTWTLPNGKTQGGWLRNAVAYSLWLHYGDMVDVFALANGGGADRRAADVLPTAAGISYCDKTEHIAFTGTDCNLLYQEQYGGTEYPARLDHLMVHDPGGRVAVDGARIVFTERLDLGVGSPIEASDHYGVEARLRVTPP